MKKNNVLCYLNDLQLDKTCDVSLDAYSKHVKSK